MSVLWMCMLFVWGGNAEIPWEDLITAKITKQSRILDPQFWMDAKHFNEVHEAYLLTLGQIGNPKDAPVLLKAFNRKAVQGTAVFAYGELEKADIKPLLDWLPKVDAANRHLIMEALSKHAAETQYAQVVAAWKSLTPKNQNQTLFYLWRLKPQALTNQVIATLEKSNTANLDGYVYYLFRSRTNVPASLVSKILDDYANDTQVLIYASRIPVEGDAPELVKKFGKLAHHPDWRMRVQALQAIDRLNGDVLKPALDLLKDEHPQVRKTAVSKLVAAKNDKADQILLDAARNASYSFIQTMVAGASDDQLKKFWPVVAHWNKLEENENSWRKWNWVGFQSRRNTPESLALVEGLAKELHSTQTTIALSALNQQAPEKALALAPELLKRQDPFVTNAVLNLMAGKELDEWTIPFSEFQKMAHQRFRDNIFQHSYIQGLKRWLPEAEYTAEMKKLADHPDYLVRYNTVRSMADPKQANWDHVFAKPWETSIPKKARNMAQSMLAEDKNYTLSIWTDKGHIDIKMDPQMAPVTVANMVYLSTSSYFVNLPLHRVVPNFVAQMGDGRGDGSGGPAYTIPCEVNPLRYERGSVGMALLSKDSGGSQFFICHSDQPHLDGGYTIFGKVSEEGMKILDQMEEGDVIRRVAIKIEDGAPAALK